MKNPRSLQFADLPKNNASLFRLQTPRPVQDPVKYGHLTEVTNATALWQDDFTADQREYFERLCRLQEDYGRSQARWPKVSARPRL
jgi:hypothetical protein